MNNSYTTDKLYTYMNNTVIETEDKSKIDLFFACRKLANMDIITVTDPFLKLYESRNGQWAYIGQTEQIDNNLNPNFSKSFTVDFIFEAKQLYKIEAYDYDDENTTTYIGEHEFYLGELAGAKDNTIVSQLIDRRTGKDKRGYVIVRYENVSENNDQLFFQFSANSIFQKRWFFYNKNFMFFFKPKNKGKIQHLIDARDCSLDKVMAALPNEEDWSLVFRSEHVKGKQVKWDKFMITASKLCSGDFDCPVKVVLMDFRDWSGNHRITGYTMFTVNQLKTGTHELTFTKRGTFRGKLNIMEYYDKPNYDFVDYLKGGLNIALHLAIDFTASNKDPDDPKSLHYFNGNVDNLNPYQDAIMSVGEILLNYDTDKMVPVYGFGAKPKYPNFNQNYVNHCFNCTGDPNQEEVYGINGIFETYNYALSNIVLSGPTHFSETFRKVVNECKESFKEDPYNYCFFMIITDGIIHDMQKTIDLLVEASSLPMSIVIVGVGNEDFTRMRQLDDAEVTDSWGRSPKRDIVRFVEHNKFKNNRMALSKETLEEIPGQVTSFYASINKKPMPARGLNLSQVDNMSNLSYEQLQTNRTDAQPLLPNVLPGNMNQPPPTGPYGQNLNNMQQYGYNRANTAGNQNLPTGVMANNTNPQIYNVNMGQNQGPNTNYPNFR